MGKIKVFFNDYWALNKASMAFMKKHWVGTVLLSAGIFAVELVPAYVRYKKSERELEAMANSIILTYEKKGDSKFNFEPDREEKEV